jgi:hypothetical protein
MTSTQVVRARHQGCHRCRRRHNHIAIVFGTLVNLRLSNDNRLSGTRKLVRKWRKPGFRIVMARRRRQQHKSTQQGKKKKKSTPHYAVYGKRTTSPLTHVPQLLT